MKIKRFFSSDMRSVIRMVREEMGADAVILSNSRVNGGVEVVAAVDYDESIFNDNTTKNAPLQSPSDRVETPLANIPAVARQAPPASPLPDRNELAGLRQSSPIDALLNSAATHYESSASAQSTPPSGVRSAPRSASPSVPQTPSQPVAQTTSATQNAHGSGQTGKQVESGAAQAGRSRRDKQSLQRSRRDEFDDLNEQQKKDSDFSFYLLGDEDNDGGSESLQQDDFIEESLFDTRTNESVAVQPYGADEAEHADRNTVSVWSQEPVLTEMRKDIQSLRGLLEQQLSGLAWGDLGRQNPVQAKVLRQLLALDINAPLAGKIAEAAGKHSEFEKAWQAALNLVTHNLPTISDDMITDGGIIALVGPTGVGKTTTVAKLAARYALRHGRNRVALVTTDSFRIAAHEQLRTYGRILGMPVRIATNKEELVETLQSFSDKDLVLIDTAGMSHRDVRLVEQFSMITDSAPSIKSLLVMSATTQRSGLDEIVRVFRNVDLDGCVLTKVDETTGLAGCLSVAIEHRLPVAYVGNGQKVPEDLHLARAHSLVNQSVLIARKNTQPMGDESLELAFSRVKSNAYV